MNKTELGLYPKEWNPRVHGIYCHWRYYGTNSEKLTFNFKLITKFSRCAGLGCESQGFGKMVRSAQL